MVRMHISSPNFPPFSAVPESRMIIIIAQPAHMPLGIVFRFFTASPHKKLCEYSSIQHL